MADDGDLLMEEMPPLLDENSPAVPGPSAVPEVVEDSFTDVKPKRGRKRRSNNPDETPMETTSAPIEIPALKKKKTNVETRYVPVPSHRYTPLKKNWAKIFTPLVEHLGLQVRFNLKTRNVEIRPSPTMSDVGNLQKGMDFLKAFLLGFDTADALALLRLDELFLDSFEIQDVKPLKGEHLSRAIGRLAGKDGRTKFTIENITKTRIVLANSKIHILGSFQNSKIARNAICSLIMGSPPSKVYGSLRSLASRAAESL